MAHRFSWSLHFGPIPTGQFVCHRCDNPPCVRPDHLFLGTSADNVADMDAKGRRVSKPNPLRGDAHPSRLHPERVRRGVDIVQSKLTDERVRYIRDQVAGGRMQKALAAELGVSKITVSRVVRRVLWAHVA